MSNDRELDMPARTSNMNGFPRDVVGIAQALIRLASVNPYYDSASQGESAVCDWIIAWAREHQLEATTQPVAPGRDNVLITLRHGADHPHILLNGHMDTVGVSDMVNDPFGGDIAEGRLHGRGAADMKGPLAAMMAAMLDLADQGSPWRGTVTLAAVVDEEYRFIGIQKLLAERSFDFAIVGEPTALEVVRGCKGCLRFSITTTGRAAHSSRPHEGANAISAMAQIIPALESHFASRLGAIHETDFGSSTGSIGVIRGGTGVNIVPDRCEIEIDVRLVPSQDGWATHREIRELIDSLPTPPGVTVDVSEPKLCDPGYQVPADHELVQRSLTSAERTRPQVVAFSCDASKIAAKGIPCVICGPGDIAQAHTARESIGVDELEAGREFYARVVRELAPG